jgi:adenine-specific DNA-methyltransferase
MPAMFNLMTGTQILVYPNNSDEPHSTRLPEDRKTWLSYKPVEQIIPGDYLVSLDNKIHQVEHCTSELYDGPFYTIHNAYSDDLIHVKPDSLIMVKRRVQSMSISGHWSSIPSGHFQRARELRNRMTPPEWQLWKWINNKNLGIKFRPQHPIGPYITDFYARKAFLVIEIDGQIAHSTNEQITEDQNRDAWLRSLGLKVLRYPAKDVFTNIQGVIDNICVHIRECAVDEIPQAQWLFSQNLTTNDEIYFSDKRLLSQVINIAETHHRSQWFTLILKNRGNIITQTLIHNSY